MHIKKYYDNFVNVIAILFLVVLTYVTFHQVVVRVAGHPAEWTEELSRFLFVWTSFLGAAIAFRYGSHLGVDFLVKLMPKRVSRWIALLFNLVLIVAIGTVFWISAGMIADAGLQRSPILRMPMSYPYLAIPVGFGLMFIEVVWNLAMDVAGKQSHGEIRSSLEER